MSREGSRAALLDEAVTAQLKVEAVELAYQRAKHERDMVLLRCRENNITRSVIAHRIGVDHKVLRQWFDKYPVRDDPVVGATEELAAEAIAHQGDK